MDELISKKAAIDEGMSYINGDCFCDKEDFAKYIEFIEQLPPIQPEIVRCGECKYCVHHPATPNAKRPCDAPQPEMWHCGKNREFKPRVMPHDFCSRGKRREVTT